MKNTKPTNPNAFPTMEHGLDSVGLPSVSTYEGMTLRDYFASSAMQGMISNSGMYDVVTESAIKSLSKESYLIADEMLKQREL